MQMQSYMHTRKVGYVRGELKEKVSFERLPAIKKSVADDGSVLLRPKPNNQSIATVTLTEGMIEQVSVIKPKNVRTPPPKIPRNTSGSSMQCSPLIVGMGKAVCCRKLEF